MNVRYKKTQKEVLRTGADRNVYHFSKFYGVSEEKEGALCAVSSQNCDCRGGVLTSGLGMSIVHDEYENDIVLYNDGINVKQVAYARTKTSDGYTEELLLLQENDKLSRYDLWSSEFMTIKQFSENSDMQMINTVNEDAKFTIVLYGKDGEYRYGDKLYKIHNGQAEGACLAKSRLFLGVIPYTIAYSKAGNCVEITDSVDDSGCIYFVSDKGEIVEIQSLQDEVYVFLERGTFRLGGNGGARDFVLEEIPFHEGRVLKHSVRAVKDKLLFLTENGAFTFDGKTFQQSYQAMEIHPDKSQPVRTAISEDRYLVKYTDKYKGERCIALDADGDGHTLFSMPALCSFENQAYTQKGLILRHLDASGSLPNGAVYRYVSRKFAKSEREKMLRKITLTGSGSLTLTVHSDRAKKEMPVRLTTGGVTVKPFLKGKAFWLEFVLQKDTKVTSASVETDSVKGR